MHARARGSPKSPKGTTFASLPHSPARTQGMLAHGHETKFKHETTEKTHCPLGLIAKECQWDAFQFMANASYRLTVRGS